MKLRQTIKNRRQELNYTQKKLAFLCGLSHQTVNNFEVGRSQLGSDSIDKMLDVLDLQVGQKANWYNKLFKLIKK